MIWYDVILYDMILYDMIWYDTIWYDTWYDTSHDTWYVTWYDIWYDTSYDTWYYTSYDTYDVILLYLIWKICYVIIHIEFTICKCNTCYICIYMCIYIYICSNDIWFVRHCMIDNMIYDVIMWWTRYGMLCYDIILYDRMMVMVMMMTTVIDWTMTIVINNCYHTYYYW